MGAPKSPCRLMLLSPDRPSSTDTHNSDTEVNNNNVSNSNEDEEKAGSSGKRSGKKMLPCDYCGKCFDRPSLLNRHLRTHTGERPHVCNICGKGFSTSSSLNTHRRIHSGEKPHECGVCGKRFTASSNLYYHRMTHVKVSPTTTRFSFQDQLTNGALLSLPMASARRITWRNQLKNQSARLPLSALGRAQESIIKKIEIGITCRPEKKGERPSLPLPFSFLFSPSSFASIEHFLCMVKAIEDLIREGCAVRERISLGGV